MSALGAGGRSRVPLVSRSFFPWKQLRVSSASVCLRAACRSRPSPSLPKPASHISGASRSYKPAVDDPELAIRLLRAQEISRYVEHGFLDCGLTGKDWIANNGTDVAVLAEMTFSKVSSKPTRWVIAVPEDSPIQIGERSAGQSDRHRSGGTDAPLISRSTASTAEVEFSWGATEVKVPDLVDAIVDVTETGSSLRANKLRILETIMESVAAVYRQSSRRSKTRGKRRRSSSIVLLLQGAYAARDKVGLKMNLPEARLAELLEALAGPAQSDDLASRHIATGSRSRRSSTRASCAKSSRSSRRSARRGSSNTR